MTQFGGYLITGFLVSSIIEENMHYVFFVHLYFVSLLFLRKTADLRDLKRANKRGFKIAKNKE